MTLAFPARVVEANARVYRRTFRGSVVSTFLNPVLFLLAMGVGLGKLVDAGAGESTLALPYLTFLAPGLLAATAMTTAAGDSAFPVMAGIKWRKTYDAVLATPIGVGDLVAGHLGWIAIRLTFVTLVYSGVMTAFGATTVVEGLVSVPPAILTGMAFAALVTAYTAKIKDEQWLSNLFRFGITPLFLFSGTFFPITQLPGWLQPVAYATPLWHGVSLCRGLALRIGFTVDPWISVGYLAVLVVIGGFLSTRVLTRRLVK
ncbi:MAG TPA: ABC transporter permease [Acidimicrobiia bacterium]|jgi:lipooligosaccharide transport system permease protein